MTQEAALAEFRAGLDARETALLEEQRRAATERLGNAPNANAVQQATAGALEQGEALLRHHLAVMQPPSACRAGCDWCCRSLTVRVSAPEVFAVAAYAQSSGSSALRARIEAWAPPTGDSVRCVALEDDGTCGAYPVRPLACRAYNSLDADSCRRSLDDESELPPVHEQLARDGTAVSLGLLAALEDRGLSAELVELNASLQAALRDPSALERWLAGEAVFG